MPRESWGADGAIELMIFHVSDPLMDILSNEGCFDSSLQCLESAGLIESGHGTFGERSFKIKQTVRGCVERVTCDQEQEHLEWLCLVIVCHAIPGRHEDVLFGDLPRSLLPQVHHAFFHCRGFVDKIFHHPTIGYGITLTLLLSSYKAKNDWKIYALNSVGFILSHNPQFGSGTRYLEMLKGQREREISRRIPNLSIQSLCEELPPIDPRTNALYGRHLRSNSQDLIMRNCNLPNSLQETAKFEFYFNRPTEIEEVERYHMDFLKGKIYRWLARFDMASNIFYNVISSPHFQSDETGCNVVGHLVGVLCERRYLGQAESTARQHVRHLESLDKHAARRRTSMTFKSLQLSLAETLVCRAMVKRADGVPFTHENVQKLREAEGIFDLLKTEYELSKQERGASWASEMNYIQTCIGRALTSYLMHHYDEAYNLWENVREPVQLCKDVVTGFLSMIIDFSQCDISRELGKLEEAAVFLERATMLRSIPKRCSIIGPTSSRTHFRNAIPLLSNSSSNFSVLNRPPPKYEGHVPLKIPEKLALGIGSALISLWNPRRGDMVGTVAEMTAGPFIKNLRDVMLADETGRRILRDRPRINSKTVPIDHLRSYPANTFARSWVDYLDQHKMTLDMRDDVKYIDDEELAYVMQRYREGHDCGHILTGLPAAFVEGEVALKAFEFLNTGLPMTGLSLVAVMKLKPEERSRFFNTYLPWACKNGVHAKPLINVYWEEELGTPMDELRRRLGIEKSPDLRKMRKMRVEKIDKDILL
ncbi:putative Coenzyme Q (ubiquinone) biosynthesis protein Coq4 [Sclerotinia borealis F-4128]|uniref:4-hydroxy-3-methoxy-5-polyprenylbenzoate decarboxylase n=1 Tax=Sclerotinia borealis (strain F-4128) TaxID=1432307 RepID=W9CTJ9_SCLBF|nr:putative Coenzyme Q (ubiquinone) biosynthesis protein Coq4 [Sclerotinia borealis F-4128]